MSQLQNLQIKKIPSLIIQQKQMNQYFTAHTIHLEGHCDIDGKQFIKEDGKHGKVVSIGVDDALYIRNLKGSLSQQANELHQNQERIDLPTDQTDDSSFTAISLNPNGQQIILASGKKIFNKNLKSKEANTTLIYEALGKVHSITLSKRGRYLAAATQQQKCVIIDLSKQRNMKCRPGHSANIINAFFSSNQRFVASIGKDDMMLIYEILIDKEPQQVFRTKIIRGQVLYEGYSGDFHPNLNLIAAPGAKEVQFFQIADNSSSNSNAKILNSSIKWTQKASGLPHESTISICKFLNDSLLATCTISPNNFFIWAISKQQKIVFIDNISFTKIIPIYDRFFAIDDRNEAGKIFEYKKQFPAVFQAESMDIENAPNDVIDFNGNFNFNLNAPQQKDKEDSQDQQQYQDEYYVHKKSKADRIVTVFPQPPLSTATKFFGECRFLLTNLFGNIIERRGEGSDFTIEVQLTPSTLQAEHVNHDQQKAQKIILFRNRDVRYFAMNHIGIAFANQSEFGFWGKNFKMWDRRWADISGVAIGNSWVAVMNQQEIMILDFTGNQLRSYAFDRIFVAMDGFQNQLAVVYHETVPIWGNQALSMQIFTVDSFKESKSQKYSVPIRPESNLKWFGFSQQGMILSQDSNGGIRVFNLGSKVWSTVQVFQLPASRRVWIVGMINYQLKYWKTTELQTQPTVSPRLNQKLNTLFLGSSESQESEDLSHLLWQRFCLDHQKERNRLWGRYRVMRSDDHPSYQISRSIMRQSQNQQQNLKLDKQYLALIKKMIPENSQKALFLSKSMIRSAQIGRQLVSIFDIDFKMRMESIQLEKHFDQIEKQLDYENIQNLRFQSLRRQIEKFIKPKNEDPMKKRPNNERFVNFGFSQSSTNSLANSRVQSAQNDVPKKNSQINSHAPQEKLQNPFLKKKPTNEANAKRQQIEDQLQLAKKNGQKNGTGKRNRQKVPFS